MQVNAFKCDAPDCTVSKLDEDLMITATVTIKASPGTDRLHFKVHACCLNHLGEAVKLFAEV